MINEADIRQSCECESLRWTDHVAIRLTLRSICTDDVIHALMNGVIIEQYHDDYPYPSCLVNGLTQDNLPIHVVCGFGDGELWLITAYYPDAEEWTPDFKTRIEVHSQ